MRKMILVLAALAALAVPARAEEYWFMNGVYSVNVPNGWRYQEFEDFMGVSLSPRPRTFIIVTAPTMGVGKDNLGALAKAHVESFFQESGNGKIESEDFYLAGGRPVYSMTCSLVVDHKQMRGIVFAISYDGMAVSFLGMTTKDSFDDFVDHVVDVAASYDFDPGEIADNIEFVTGVSQALKRHIGADF